MNNFYWSLRAEIIINESDTDDEFQSIYITIIRNIQKSLGKGSVCIIDSVIDHTISISRYNALAGSTYIKLPKESDHLRKRLINIQKIDDNECFKWNIVRYLNPADRNPARIKKVDKEFAKKLDFKEIKVPVKIGDIHKIEKKNSIALVFLIIKMKKNIQSMYQKNVVKKNKFILLLIGKEGKRHYVLIKDFNAFMYDHSLHRGRKHFCRYCLQAFSTEELLISHIKDCFKVNGKQRIIMPKKGEYVTFKNYEIKIKLPFLIYADFKNIL